MQFSLLPTKAYTISCNFDQKVFDQKLNDAFSGISDPDDYSMIESVISYLGSPVEESFNVEKSILGRAGNQDAYIIGIGNIKSAQNGCTISISYYLDFPLLKIVIWILGLITLLSVTITVVSVLSLAEVQSNMSPILLLIIPVVLLLIIRGYALLSITTFHN